MAAKPRISRIDPFTAGKRAYLRGLPFDPEFGAKCAGWGPISAQCLYERGRLAAAEPGDKPERKRH